MRISQLLPAVASLTAVTSATPTLLSGDASSSDKASATVSGSGTFDSPVTCSLSNSWSNHVLFQGTCSAETESSAAVTLGLNIPTAQISGDISFACGASFLTAPTIRVGLGNIKTYVEVDLSASATVHESVELFVAPELTLPVVGVDVGLSAGVALDLVVGCGAAIDLSAGVYIAFPETAYVDIDLLTMEVTDISIEGLTTKALPVGVGADVDLSADIALEIGLRLRSQVSLDASLGLDIPGIDIGTGVGAGASAAIWVSLFDYTATIGAGSGDGIEVTGEFACNLGLAIDASLDVGDVLDFGLVPSLSVGLAAGDKSTFTQDDRGTCGSFIGDFKGEGSIGGPTVSASGLLTASGVYTVPGASSISIEVPQISGGVEVTASADLPEVTASAGLSVGLSIGLPSIGLPSVSLPQASVGVDVSASASVGFGHTDVSTTLGASASLSLPEVSATAEFPGASPSASLGASGSDSLPVVSIPPLSNGTTSAGYGSVPHGSHSGSVVVSDSQPAATTSDASEVTQPSEASGLITSTIHETHTYTITSCAASVINCPASYTQKVVTSTIIKKTTICPATAVATGPASEATESGSSPAATESGSSPAITESGSSPATTKSSSAPVTTAPAESQKTSAVVEVTTIIEDLTTIKQCSEIVTSTQETPKNPPPATATITIQDKTTAGGVVETATSKPYPASTLSRVVASATASGSGSGSNYPAATQSGAKGVVTEVATGIASSSNPGQTYVPAVPYPSSNGTISTGSAVSTPSVVSTPIATAGAGILTAGVWAVVAPLFLVTLF